MRHINDDRVDVLAAPRVSPIRAENAWVYDRRSSPITRGWQNDCRRVHKASSSTRGSTQIRYTIPHGTLPGISASNPRRRNPLVSFGCAPTQRDAENLWTATGKPTSPEVTTSTNAFETDDVRPHFTTSHLLASPSSKRQMRWHSPSVRQPSSPQAVHCSELCAHLD